MRLFSLELPDIQQLTLALLEADRLAQAWGEPNGSSCSRRRATTCQTDDHRKRRQGV